MARSGILSTVFCVEPVTLSWFDSNLLGQLRHSTSVHLLYLPKRGTFLLVSSIQIFDGIHLANWHVPHISHFRPIYDPETNGVIYMKVKNMVEVNCRQPVGSGTKLWGLHM